MRIVVLPVLLFATTAALAASQDDRLAEASSCLERRLANADQSQIAVQQIVSRAMRDCNVEIEQYLKGVERLASLDLTNVNAPPPGSAPAPSATPRYRSARQPERDARESARRELVHKYEKRVAEQRAQRATRP